MVPKDDLESTSGNLIASRQEESYVSAFFREASTEEEKTRKILVSALAATSVIALGMSQAMAAPKYADVKVPSTIRVIVSYKAGGSSDALARVTLPYWERAIRELTGKKTNAVVVNLPGAGGEIGWTSLASSPAAADDCEFGKG